MLLLKFEQRKDTSWFKFLFLSLFYEQFSLCASCWEVLHTIDLDLEFYQRKRQDFPMHCTMIKSQIFFLFCDAHQIKVILF